jgi:chloramphenicol-sensitive protein RarD
VAGIVTSVPLLVYAKGIQGTSQAVSGILMYVNPTLQLLIGVFLYQEPFTQAQGVTFVFVCAAVILFLADSLLRGKRQ